MFRGHFSGHQESASGEARLILDKRRHLLGGQTTRQRCHRGKRGEFTLQHLGRKCGIKTHKVEDQSSFNFLLGLRKNLKENIATLKLFVKFFCLLLNGTMAEDFIYYNFINNSKFPILCFILFYVSVRADVSVQKYTVI